MWELRLGGTKVTGTAPQFCTGPLALGAGIGKGTRVSAGQELETVATLPSTVLVVSSPRLAPLPA